MEPTPDSSSLSWFQVRYWSPPEDPDKPLLPYLPGFSVQIHRHAPPPPFGFCTEEEIKAIGIQERPELSTDYLKTVTQSEAVVANPPVGGFPSAGTAQLVITSHIAAGAARGAQVVACKITPQDGDGHPFTVAAKIYDPLYYKFKSRWVDLPEDCVQNADDDFIIETWAYESLKRTGQTGRGSFAPEYYGTWTFTLPIVTKGIPTTRPVRLILIELLNGLSIQASRLQNNPDSRAGTDSFHYPEEYRLEVVARAMEKYVRQRNTGVIQSYFAGRNIILCPDESPEPEMICGIALPRIALVDYNKATRLRPSSRYEDESRPKNPAFEFWGNWLWDDLAGWVPNSWHDVKVQDQWLLQRFCGPGQRELYSPLPPMIDQMIPQNNVGSQKDGDDSREAA